jgi:hypothetical protein
MLAVACGLAVANLYYPQPLLATIARSFRTGSGTVGLVVTSAESIRSTRSWTRAIASIIE